jgi:pimeloyl-ACP methyl ester carboxylesterase
LSNFHEAAHRVLIAGSGHISNAEKPDEFNRIVEQFIRELD